MPVLSRNDRPSEAALPTRILFISSNHRSRLTVKISPATSRTTSGSPASGRMPSVAMKRAARRVRSGSSRKMTRGSPTVRRVRCRRSLSPPNGSIRRRSAVIAMALIEKSRRARSRSQIPAEGDSRLPASVGVHLPPVGGDLDLAAKTPCVADGAHRAEPAPHGEDRQLGSAQDTRAVGRHGAGGEIQIAEALERGAEQVISHRAAHEIQFVPCADEHLEQTGECHVDFRHDHARSWPRRLPAHVAK